MQALPAPAEALCIIEMGGSEAREDTGERGSSGGLFLNIGLQVSIQFGSVTNPTMSCHGSVDKTIFSQLRGSWFESAAVAVVPLGKAFNPHCLVSWRRQNRQVSYSLLSQ